MIEELTNNRTIWLYDDGSLERDYMYITDAVDAIQLLAEKGEKGAVYLVGSGKKYSFAWMVRRMQEIAGAGKVTFVESPGFHKRVGIGNFVCDCSKLKRLGWEPTVDIEDGIRKTVEWYANG